MTYASIHTLKYAALFVCLFIAAWLLIPAQANAYFTTGQKEIDLGNGTGLFLIEYQFGMEKHEVHMPLLAQNGGEKSNAAVSYEILNEDGEKAAGNVFGIVLSTADIGEKGQYVTEKGMGHKFVLAVFFTPVVRGMDEYRMQVTHLPFNFDGTQELQLNPSELKYYTTGLLPL